MLLDFPRALVLQRLRNERHEHQRRRYRSGRRDGFDHARKPVRGMPDGPNLENVGRTAGHDKEAEHPKDTAKRYVGPLADEVHQECRNRKIGERDDGIRRDVKRQDAGISKVHMPCGMKGIAATPAVSGVPARALAPIATAPATAAKAMVPRLLYKISA